MKRLVKSIWLPFILTLVVIAIAAAAVQSLSGESTMSDGNETIAVDISIPAIDMQVPEVVETVTFALG